MDDSNIPEPERISGEELNEAGFKRIPPTEVPRPLVIRNGMPVSVVNIDGENNQFADDPIMRQINEAQEGQTSVEEPAPPPKMTVSSRATAKAPTPKPKKTPKPQPEEKTEEVAMETAPQIKKLSGKGAINAFKQAVASALFPVKMYSAGTEYLFRELGVKDQKNLSKIALMNNSRRDVVYKAQCALINKVADDEDFRIEDFTEFDRIVVLLRLYEQNYFKNEIRYKCANCGRENIYQLDFSKILAKIDDAWTTEKVYTMELPGKTFRITAGWPKVSAVSEFYDSYYKSYQNSSDVARSTIDQLSNVEYLVMFIKGIDLIVAKGEEISIDLDDLSYSDRTDVVDSLPQGIVFDDDNGVISKIVADFTDKLNNAFQYEKCQFCGAETEEGIGSVADFT